MSDSFESTSRTSIKNEAAELQKLGERLMGLTRGQLALIDIPAELKEAVITAGTIRSNKAKRRQKQYIGALMRQIDTEPVTAALKLIDDGISLKNERDSRIKKWHSDIISGNDSVIDTILSEYPDADRQRLRQLARNARKEAPRQTKEKAASALLTCLRSLNR